MIGNARFHRRGNADGAVNAAEVVEGEPQAVGAPQVVPLLAEGIGKARHAAHLHTDGEILALDMAGANPLLFGVAHDWDLLRTDDFGGAVPALPVLIRAVDLDVHGVVATVAERSGDCGDVGLETIGGDLEPLLGGSRVAQAFNENVRGGLIPAPKSEVEHELGMALHGHVAVGIALGIVILFGGQLVGFLLGHVAPDFIGLDIGNRDVHNQPAHELFAAFPGEHQGLHDRVAIHAGNPHRGADGVAFQQEFESDEHFFLRQVHLAKSEAMGFGIGLVALRAAKPEQPVAVRSEALTLHIAGFASH